METSKALQEPLASTGLSSLLVLREFRVSFRLNIHILMDLLSVAGDGGTEANYKVVDTDYDNYAIVYDCSPKLFLKKGNKQHLYQTLPCFSLQNLSGFLQGSKSQILNLSSGPTSKFYSIFFLPLSNIKIIVRQMRTLGLPLGSLRKTPQTNCSKLPPPGQAAPVLTIESLG